MVEFLQEMAAHMVERFPSVVADVLRDMGRDSVDSAWLTVRGDQSPEAGTEDTQCPEGDVM